MRNLLIVISGPSGVGKGTIVKRLMQRGDFALSVSCTTRKPRAEEEEGKSYFFIDNRQFTQLIQSGGLLEYSNHFEHYYGTPRAFVEKQLESKDVILEIEVDGGLQVKKSHPETLLLMVLPPDRNELYARLQGRGTENPEEIAERLSRMDYELEMSKLYDYSIINDKLDRAVEEIENIIRLEKLKRSV